MTGNGERTPQRSTRTALIAICFASGAAALIYQAVWIRWFQILFGNTAYAASATLCAFFAGLAIGSEIFGRVAARSRRPLRIYAGIEVLAAAAALLVPFVFRLYDPIYAELYDALADRRGLFVAIKFGLALLVMLPSSLLLGGTLPLLATAYIRDPLRLGREGGLLYAVNTVGAAVGSAAGVLLLPELIGVRGTYAAGVALSITAGFGAWLVGRRMGAATPLPAAASSDSPAPPAALLTIAFASGFGILAFEVLLIRSVAQIIDHSIFSFGAVLVVVLLALAVGAAIVSATANRISARALLAGALVGEAILLLVLPAVAERLTHEGLVAVGSVQNGFAIAAGLGGPPLLVAALVFPLTMRLAAGGSVGRRVGGLLAANTIGGILGSVSASFLFLDGLGLWPSIAVLGIGYGMASLLTQGSARGRVLRGVAIAATVVAVFASAANPLRLPVVSVGENDRLVDASEGAYGIVAVLDGPQGRRMTHNNHYTLSGAGPLSVGRERLGHLPLLLHPEPRSAAFVGSATGITAGASVLHSLDEIVLVEIVPEVQRFAAEHFAASNRGVHRDPRTRLVVEDGRNHLRATRDRYDVIVADLFVPWRAGVGSLYSREHFEAVKAHLSGDGVFCQWLPLYQFGPREFAIVAATFLDVFPNATVWRADFYSRVLPRMALVGFAGSPPTVPEVESRIQQIAAVGVADRWIANPDGFWMLYVGPLVRAKDRLAGVERNRDDSPVFEFRAARSKMSERRAFVRSQWPAFTSELSPAGSGDAAPFGERGIEGARAGALLARINRLVLNGFPSKARTGMAALRESIPPELLSPPDPTVAEMWWPRQRAKRKRSQDPRAGAR